MIVMSDVDMLSALQRGTIFDACIEGKWKTVALVQRTGSMKAIVLLRDNQRKEVKLSAIQTNKHSQQPPVKIPVESGETLRHFDTLRDEWEEVEFIRVSDEGYTALVRRGDKEVFLPKKKLKF